MTVGTTSVDPTGGAAFEPVAANPFSPRAVLALVGFGAIVFMALLWMIGTGQTTGSTNDGGAHAGSNGLTGYAAFARFAERRGYTLRRSQNEGALEHRGLLVLTPPQWSDGAELERIVSARRYIGPTLVIVPKWQSIPVGQAAPQAKRGWVQLGPVQPPSWKGFHDEIVLHHDPRPGGGEDWTGAGLAAPLPAPESIQWATGDGLLPIVLTRAGGRMLAGYVDDGSQTDALDELAGFPPAGSGNDAESGNDGGSYPLVFVFEPDLLNNYGFARLENARLADELLRAITADSGNDITFDLTLNGFARSANLLTLAFTPPFLAATLCLLIAGIAAGWRAFARFGPPRRAVRAIAFGKRALTTNAAGLIRRTRRFHLIAAPYAEAARGRLVRELALPRLASVTETEAAIDRALAARQPGGPPFSVIAARLRAARRPHDLLKAAQDLHALERTLTR